MTEQRGEFVEASVLADRIVDRGLAMMLAGALSVGSMVLWWVWWVLTLPLVVWIGKRFLDAVGDLTDMAQGPHSSDGHG